MRGQASPPPSPHIDIYTWVGYSVCVCVCNCGENGGVPVLRDMRDHLEIDEVEKRWTFQL